MIKDLETHFNGECGEVGMYLAMSRQADREGYPEIAEAFKRYAFEEAEHASKFAELLGDVLKDTKSNNAYLSGRTVAEISDFLNRDVVFSRLFKNGEYSIPTSRTIFDMGDEVFLMML